MPRFRRPAAAILVLFTLWPTLVFGQASKAGVVTTLEGNVTVTRVALPQPQPLKFKDDVFVNDKVTTGDRAIVRMLLGGKAVVTVRERSSLTITEVPGKSTIDLDAGKIALAVAKDKLKPGELIEIRTQNAVAGVRGTVVVAEVSRATAQAGGPAPALVTTLYVLRGFVEALQINPATGAPVGAPLQVGSLQQFRAAGISPAALSNIPPAQVAQIIADVTVKKLQHTQGPSDEHAKETAVNSTVTLVNVITGQGGGGGETVVGQLPPTPLTQPTGNPPPPILPGGKTSISGILPSTPSMSSSTNLPVSSCTNLLVNGC